VTRGGARAGAGRPALGDAARVRVTLTLEPAILEAVDRVSREQAISRSEAANRLLSGGLWDVDLAGAVDLSSSAVDL
jgi:hypothetical protein